jgi:membrane associated rhomboid family serine protease
MSSPTIDLLEIILRECANVQPGPWYPADYAAATGVSREALDPALDQLRLAGLIQLTEWVQGKGQGYALTPAGETVLEKPRLLDRLRAGTVPKVEQPRQQQWQEDAPPGMERARAVRDALLDRSRPVVTLSLIAANCLMFIVGMAMAQQGGVVSAYLATPLGGPARRADAADLRVAEIRFSMGALVWPAMLDRQEWWRLLATCFLHGGLIHLALNMYFLFSVGPPLERMLGSWRFLLLYLISGLTGSCAAIIFGPRTIPAIQTIGASGALCGLLVAVAAWVYVNRPYLPRDLAGTWMRGILTNVILIVFISLIPGISASGHFGGGVGGLLAAVPLTYSRFGTGPQRWLGLLGAFLVPLAAVAWLEHSLAPTELERARLHIPPLVLEGQGIARAAFDNHVQPLCKDLARNGKAPGADALRAALAEAAEAQGRLQKLEDSLPQPTQYEDPQVRAAIGFCHNYFKAWIDLFDYFQTAARGPKGLTVDDARAVLGRHRPVARAVEQLTDSVLGLVEEKER